ncbi:MAG: transposase [Candidatus Omnitrophota bacterium]
MSRPLRIEYPGAFYHITSRGNERKNIYDSDQDREKFLGIVSRAYERFKIRIHAYCLMSNHYHFLMETTRSNLSRCMQYINSTYTNYFNRKKKRCGHLFQHRYLGLLIEENSYLTHLSRYIHLNPVRAGLVKTPEEYAWSSYRYYISSKNSPDFLVKNNTLGLFNGNTDHYRAFVEEGLLKELKNPLLDAFAGLVLGGDKFMEKIKREHIEKNKKTRDLPSLRALNKDILNPSNIIRIIKQCHELSHKEKSKLMVYFMRNFTDLTLEEISARMEGIDKISSTAAWKIVKRVEDRIDKDSVFGKIVTTIRYKMANGEARHH